MIFDPVTGKTDGAPAPFQLPTDWSQDSRFIAYQTSGAIAAPGADVFVVDLVHGQRLIPLVQSPAQELGAGFSPDETWLTYLSDQSGRIELYAQAFQAAPTVRLLGTPRQRYRVGPCNDGPQRSDLRKRIE